MWLRKEKFDGMVSNISDLKKSMHVLMTSIEVFAPRQDRSVNPYRAKNTKVQEIKRKFKGEADFGNQIIQRLVNLRVAFSVPNRLFIITNPEFDGSKGEVNDVKEYINNFMALNSLDSALPRDLAREVEFEGQVATRIVWDPKEKLPRLKYYPQAETGYAVEATSDFLVNSNLQLKFTHNGKEKVIRNDEFSFIAFNDQLNVFIGYPTCGNVLVTAENIDKDLRDWRKLNHLFGHPTPHFRCEKEEDAKAVNNMIRSTGWKVGTAFATNSDFKLVGPSGVEGQMLMLSIQTGAKILSAHTGIGIHFIGFANVLSNRATADSMGEPTEVVLHSEIASWIKFYTDVFKKAIRLRNKHLNKELPEDAVLPRLVPLTDRQFKALKDIYMPLADNDHISEHTLLSKIPDIDAEEEVDKIKREEKEKEKKAKKQAEQQPPIPGQEQNKETPPGQQNAEEQNNNQ